VEGINAFHCWGRIRSQHNAQKGSERITWGLGGLRRTAEITSRWVWAVQRWSSSVQQ